MKVHFTTKTRRALVFATLLASALLVAIWGLRQSILQRTVDADAHAFKTALRELINVANDFGMPGSIIVTRDGEERFSWRYELHHFLDPVHDTTGLPVGAFSSWDSVEHAQITNAGYGRYFRKGVSPYSCIFGIIGRDSAFPQKREFYADAEDRRDPKDLPNNLILTVQVRQDRIQWNQPDDLDFNVISAVPEGTTLQDYPLFQGPIFVGFNDETVWRLAGSTPIEAIARFCAVTGAKAHDREQELGRYVIGRY